MVAVGLVGVLYSAMNISAHVWSDAKYSPMVPTQLNTLILTVLGIAFICSWAAWLWGRIARRLDVKSEHRYQVVKSALVDLGARVEENTGEMRRVAGGEWQAVDPSVAAMLRRLDRDFPASGSQSQ
jgi:hypothetical protein